MVDYLILVISIFLAVVGQLLMKQGMLQFGRFPITKLLVNIIPMFLNPWVFIGLMAFGIGSVFWLAVLSRLPLSLAYPMVSLAYVVVAFASIFLFGEQVSLIRWIGILVICAGVYLISRT